MNHVTRFTLGVRRLKSVDKNIDHVKGNEEDKEKCEVESCGEWMPWAEWSQCLSIPQNYPGLR